MSDLERIVKAAETALHVATNEQHETEVLGRAVRYELKGYFYKWELNFKAEVVDVATGEQGEAKHFVNKDSALENAIQDLFSKLEQKGLLTEASTTSRESNTTHPPIASAATGRQLSSSENKTPNSPVAMSADAIPSLVHLLSFPVGKGRTVNIPKQIGTNYTAFGILLLNDHTGAIVDGIAHRHLNNTVQINTDILRTWIGGEGRKPVSWRTLIATLGQCGMDTIAEDIQETFN